MSSDNDGGGVAKKPRLESAGKPSSVEPGESQSATSIRDLIFSITGTMPTEVESDAKRSETFSGIDGVKLSSPVKSPTAASSLGAEGDGSKDAKSERGALCYGTETSVSGGKACHADGAISTEADVGITEFISQHEGFSGILKQRYSDFVVNEIAADGTVVHLTDVKQPASFEEAPATDEEMPSVLTDELMTRLQQLSDSKNTADEVLIQADDKEVRGQLHHFIKTKFPNLDSNMLDRDGVKHVCVKYLATRRADRKPACFTKSTGDFCQFVLYKENTDTLHAVNTIAKFLRVSPGNLGYAGTKDRRGKTTQEVTIYRIPPTRLHALNKRLRNITIGNFRICKQPLKLGDLLGNHFVILLRNVTGLAEQIETAMSSLRDVGFINYYGMQRFGTTRVATHAVGRALLSGAWSEAVELIMKPREGDRQEMVKAREVWQSSHDARKAIAALRGFECTERRLLEGLKRCMKNDLITALSFIPRNMRLMYAHAYQSYVWNRVVSRRILEFGLAPRPGDLAFRGQFVDVDEAAEMAGNDAAADATETTPNEDGEVRAAGENATASSIASSSKNPESSSSSSRIEPILLTEENIGEFTIADVVLPLPGFDVRYPSNESGSWYRSILVEDGFEPDFDFRSRVKDYSLSGGYRKIVIKPENLSWEVMHYDDCTKPLILGDLDLIDGKVTQPSPPPTADTADGSGTKFKALKLELTLPPSTYATMAVREVLKCSTSAAFQTTLNVT